MMKPFLRALVLLSIAALAWAQPAADRRELMKLPADAQSVVNTWLHQDCGIEEVRRLHDRLQQLGLALEPVFWEAYRLGPTDAERSNLIEQSRQRFPERQAHLRQFGERLFGKEEATRQLATSEEQYVQRRVEDYVNRYRSAALAGLGVAGSETSELKAIAQDDRNPAQGAAKDALQSIARRQKR